MACCPPPQPKWNTKKMLADMLSNNDQRSVGIRKAVIYNMRKQRLKVANKLTETFIPQLFSILLCPVGSGCTIITLLLPDH